MVEIGNDMKDVFNEIKEQRPELQDDQAIINYCLINTIDVIRTKGLTKFDFDTFMERLEQIETRLLEIEIAQKKLLEKEGVK